ncbi:hypothetical protein M011DRAFT_411675 [Sporormia fimetaria CBS 119925]|uniref:Altered inheritance of mitochondria protein 32 n=1 Tax=Sporormia fimetaria CBS 119925 TaxID=1340428 RepID=A0A6A6UYW8_9PLEO|nr:hypothetical protein M011DRAFT_411675 [Sporormia fimetaria CBS 119925]
MSHLCSRPWRVLSALRIGNAGARRYGSQLQHIPTCPSPTCPCAPTPQDLDIDRKTPLLHTMAAYTEQLFICTGRNDWTSRVEDEPSSAGDFVRGVKGIIGRGGKAFDPFNNVMTTLSSLPASSNPATTTALLFPSFVRIPDIPHTPSAFDALATAYLKTRHLHPAHNALSDAQKTVLKRDESLASQLPAAVPIDTVTVLICGHGSRDSRCGILGPILEKQFKETFKRKGVEAEVGMISHIGGHKYAGNVIIYIPPTLSQNELKGTGVWYGRVDPEKVEGVVDETIGKGRIIVDLFRGGITQDGGNLARMLEEQLKKERGETETLRLRPKPRT